MEETVSKVGVYRGHYSRPRRIVWYIYREHYGSDYNYARFLGKKKWVKTYQAAKKFTLERYAVKAAKQLGYKHKFRTRGAVWAGLNDLADNKNKIIVDRSLYCDRPTYVKSNRKNKQQPKEGLVVQW